MQTDKYIIWALIRVDGVWTEPEKNEFHYIYFNKTYKMYMWTTDITRAAQFPTIQKAASCPDYIYGHVELHPDCRYNT